MAISVTCPCGARLEIDEKFLGKEIPCPDCLRPLPTQAIGAPPPLPLPDNRRVSGWAVLSLALALVGAFTIVGTLAAIAVGIHAIRSIARRPGKLEGAGYARAGIIVGAVFTFITLAALVSPTVFGIDVFMRELVWVGRLERTTEEFIKPSDDSLEMKRPSRAWARYNPKIASDNTDPLVVVDVADDVYITCLVKIVDAVKVPEGEERKKLVLDCVYKSELVRLLAHVKEPTLGREGTIVAEKAGPGNKEEIVLDLHLGRHNRRLLIRSTVDQVKLNVVVAIARRNRFEAMKDELGKIMDTVKFK